MTRKISRQLVFGLVFLSVLIALTLLHHISPVSGGYRMDVFPVNGGWGYQVYKGHEVLIYQPFIPVIAGKIPFPDRKSARRTGRLVIDRLEQGKLPRITPADLNELGIAPSP